MAIAWTDWNNGDSLLLLRNNLNTFNNSAVTDVTTNSEDIAALEAPEQIPFTPRTVAPSHVEGQIYYDKNRGNFKAQGPISGVEVSLGHQQHIHIINNSGAPIEKGMAVRHNGVDVQGRIQVEKAIATSFVNALVLGVVQEEIANGAIGAIATSGEISSLNTSAVSGGVPLYLSDTVAGTWVETAPTIITQIGGVTISDVADGVLIVSIINNASLPNIYGGLQGQVTPLYSLTTTAQDIANYTTETEKVVTVDATTGVITLPNAGDYRANFVSTVSFDSAVITRVLTFEVYDVTGATIAYSYIKNVPRNATQDSLSFQFPAEAVVNNQVKMRVKSSVAMDLTFDNIIFDIISVNIR